MEEAINRSQGVREKWVNEAEGRAAEIRALASATATSIRQLAEAIATEGGDEAVALQVAEQYITELGKLARAETNVVVPANLTDMQGMLDQVYKLLGKK